MDPTTVWQEQDGVSLAVGMAELLYGVPVEIEAAVQIS
jgi:hypothetical protein